MRWQMNNIVKIPSLYLAGSIRDGNSEDIDWREKLIMECQGLAIFLNPLAGVEHDEKTDKWHINGVVPGGKFIVKHDFRMVDIADVIVFNLLCLADKYPTIGSLIEFGRATNRSNCLLYSILPAKYLGHGNTKMYKLHPFIEENSAVIFNGVDPCINFLKGQLKVISGMTPNYKGRQVHIRTPGQSDNP